MKVGYSYELRVYRVFKKLKKKNLTIVLNLYEAGKSTKFVFTKINTFKY